MLVFVILGIIFAVTGVNAVIAEYESRKLNKLIARRIEAEEELKRTMRRNGINIPGL